MQITLYKGLQVFLSGLDEWASHESSNLADLEASLRELVQELMLREIDASVEAIRQERAQAALAYVQFCEKAGFDVPEQLRLSIIGWREQERSESVKRVLRKAEELLKVPP